MIDDSSRVTAFKWAALLPRLLGVPLWLNHSIKSIAGKQRVESVDIEDAAGQVKTVACDGVIFSGRFVAESSLVRLGHLQLDARSGGPVVDQYGRCSDPDYFACGNLLHPVDTAGWCWSEGRRLAAFVHADLVGELPQTGRVIDIETSEDNIRYFTPQRIALPRSAAEMNLAVGSAPALQMRFKHGSNGCLRLRSDGTTVASRKLRARAETRQLLALPLDKLFHCQSLSLELTGHRGD